MRREFDGDLAQLKNQMFVSGIPTDYLEVTPSDDSDNCGKCFGLYFEAAGNVAVTFVNSDAPRVIAVAAGYTLVGTAKRVHSTGTTATGIWAMQV